MSDNILGELGERIKKYDKDRYLCSLFCNETSRKSLYAIYAFNIELAKIPEITSEPLVGMIRLQWWREAIEEIYSGEKVRQHEIVNELNELAKNKNLSKELFLATIDARQADMESYPVNDMAGLINYAENTSSSIMKLSAQAIGVYDEEVAEILKETGIVWGLAGIVRSVKFHAGMNRCYIPGVNIDHIYSDPELAKAVKEICGIAEDKIKLIRAKTKNIRKDKIKELLPLLLLVTISEIYLERIRSSGFEVINTDLESNRTSINLKVLWKAWLGKF